MSDPLLDWLNRFGSSEGFQKDHELPGYQTATDLSFFLDGKKAAFAGAVVAHIRRPFQFERVQLLSEAGIARTDDLMRRGVETIFKPVLPDYDRGLVAIPDLIVRSDVLNRLVQVPALALEDQIRPAPALNAPHHYLVVMIEYTTLELNARGAVGNDASDRRRKAILFTANRALGQKQGFEPWFAFLLGRAWRQGSARGLNCFDRLGPCSMRDEALGKLVDEGFEWLHRLQRYGSGWQLFPLPTVAELYPNMGNTQDAPWHEAKKQIAESLGDLTQLWRVTPRNRPLAHAKGIYHLGDPKCTSRIFGLADGHAAKLQRILDANRAESSSTVQPERIRSDEYAWREPNPLEFYVDFETVSDLDDDLSSFPEKGGQPLIFMIGCGHVEGGQWCFRVFTCDRLDEADELKIIGEWISHMQEVRTRLWPEGHPLVFHWSHAEISTLESAYNSARKRHGGSLPELNWYDFLNNVVREEPVTVKGAFAFGLKSLAKAMHANGLIGTEWRDGPGDGLAAMVGAWTCNAHAVRRCRSMRDYPLMRSIEAYNEVDCRVIWEIVSYLRANH